MNMQLLRTLLAAFALSVFTLGMISCEEDTGDQMEDAADNVEDAAEETADEIGDAAEGLNNP